MSKANGARQDLDCLRSIVSLSDVNDGREYLVTDTYADMIWTIRASIEPRENSKRRLIYNLRKALYAVERPL